MEKREEASELIDKERNLYDLLTGDEPSQKEPPSSGGLFFPSRFHVRRSQMRYQNSMVGSFAEDISAGSSDAFRRERRRLVMSCGGLRGGGRWAGAYKQLSTPPAASTHQHVAILPTRPL